MNKQQSKTGFAAVNILPAIILPADKSPEEIPDIIFMIIDI